MLAMTVAGWLDYKDNSQLLLLIDEGDDSYCWAAINESGKRCWLLSMIGMRLLA